MFKLHSSLTPEELANGILPHKAHYYFSLTEDLNQDPPVIDISSFDNWYRYGHLVLRDFKFIRDRLKDLVKEMGGGDVDVGFDLLTPEQQLIAGKLCIPTRDKGELTFGVAQSIKYTIDYNKNIYEVRRVRALIGQSYTRIYLNENAKYVLRDILDENNLYMNYVSFGIEGTLEEGPLDVPYSLRPGIADYLYGRAGTMFEANGLIDRNYPTSTGEPISNLVDILYNILIIGNYDYKET